MTQDDLVVLIKTTERARSLLGKIHTLQEQLQWISRPMDIEPLYIAFDRGASIQKNVLAQRVEIDVDVTHMEIVREAVRLSIIGSLDLLEREFESLKLPTTQEPKDAVSDPSGL